MAQLEEMQVTFNVAALDTTFEFTDNGSSGPLGTGDDADGGTFTPAASFYFVTPVSEQFHAGIAIASQGGSGMDYGDNFKGQNLMENVEFMTVQIAPAMSYKINSQWSVGAAVNFEYFSAQGELDVLPNTVPGIAQGVLEAEADDFNIGYSLSAFYQPNQKHRFGLFTVLKLPIMAKVM